jgi:hypothetical protein
VSRSVDARTGFAAGEGAGAEGAAEGAAAGIVGRAGIEGGNLSGFGAGVCVCVDADVGGGGGGGSGIVRFAGHRGAGPADLVVLRHFGEGWDCS